VKENLTEEREDAENSNRNGERSASGLISCRSLLEEHFAEQNSFSWI
jgi:hypothetical protein